MGLMASHGAVGEGGATTPEVSAATGGMVVNTTPNTPMTTAPFIHRLPGMRYLDTPARRHREMLSKCCKDGWKV